MTELLEQPTAVASEPESIEKVERGDNDLEVRVTFARPYADWKSLFSPLYPKQVTGTPDSLPSARIDGAVPVAR